MDLKEARQILKDHGWTQKDIGDFLGYTQGMISMLFSEKANSRRKTEVRNKMIILAEIHLEMNQIMKSVLRRLSK